MKFEWSFTRHSRGLSFVNRVIFEYTGDLHIRSLGGVVNCLLTLFLATFWGVSCLAQSGAAEKSPGFLMQAMPFLAMFFIFYFLMMRPQIKKQKTHQDFLQALKKGDRVLTSSGIFGTIEGLTDKYVKLEIADDVSIRVLKAHVSQPVKEG